MHELSSEEIRRIAEARKIRYVKKRGKNGNVIPIVQDKDVSTVEGFIHDLKAAGFAVIPR